MSIVDPSGSYNLQPYGGRREIMSLRRQIVETEDAALEARLQSQSAMKRTQRVTAAVEEKVEHMHGANTKLDSELEEIERQIEELKRISRSQVRTRTRNPYYETEKAKPENADISRSKEAEMQKPDP